MNIPQIDQDLATIKATEIQFTNGYHLSKNDYSDFLDAMIRLKVLAQDVKKQYHKEQ